MEVRIKDNQGYVDADWTIEDGIMVVSPKEVKFEPKEGDVIVCKNSISSYTLICKNVSGNIVYSHALLLHKTLHLDTFADYMNPRYATEEEKKLLFDRLAEKDWSWDADKKELVKLKWKPIYADWYFFPKISPDNLFTPDKYRWGEHKTDKALYDRGWCFKTEEECKAFCDKLNQAISEVSHDLR